MLVLAVENLLHERILMQQLKFVVNNFKKKERKFMNVLTNKIRRTVAFLLAMVMVFSCNIQAFAISVSVENENVETAYVKQEDLDKLVSLLRSNVGGRKIGLDTGIKLENFTKCTSYCRSVEPLLLLSVYNTNNTEPSIVFGPSGMSLDSPVELCLGWYKDSKPEEAITRYDDMKNKIDAIVAAAPEDYTAKLKYFADYVCDNATYDYDMGPRSGCVEGFFYDGKVVCQGYAYMFYTLCYYAGIECCFIPVILSSGDKHGYNAVKVDGIWKKIDTCWMDGDDNNRNYSYFLASLSEKEINAINSEASIVSVSE